ncbi:protein LATERAL ORGAN BOUNDARIES-like [Benincasa hispida]|uniref:protein LATERAL ORGAN BOUNDARIES-like n=1 Tax=Benincasa hispida TaxID=102211 RepID=UPI0019028F67|nr:protein LATERAL ORGAN BOUNDARIES-like [Benincasa hispida]
MGSTTTSNSHYYSPCAACKFLRRKCLAACVFAPYFPPEDPQKFANVHKVFGASNVAKLLNDVLPHQRQDAVVSLAYEAEARIRDPVYGCVGAISFLQKQVQRLQKELDAAKARLFLYSSTDFSTPFLPPHPQIITTPHPLIWNNNLNLHNNNNDIITNYSSMYFNGGI